MLDGILTTALQIIIVLDICGAVFYVLMSAAGKNKQTAASQSSQGAPVLSPTPQYAFPGQLQPAMAGNMTGNIAVASEPPPIPEWVSSTGDRSATQIYGLEGAAEAAPEPAGLTARVSGIFSTIKGKFQRQNTHESAGSADLNNDQKRLSSVLESFREEM
jgi:hypothetical protein